MGEADPAAPATASRNPGRRTQRVITIARGTLPGDVGELDAGCGALGWSGRHGYRGTGFWGKGKRESGVVRSTG